MRTQSTRPGSKRLAAGAAMALAAALPLRAQPPAQPQDIAYLRSEQFRRDFLGSYGIRTDVEPRLNNEEEKLRFEEMATLIASDPRKAVGELEAFVSDETSAQFDFVLGNLYLQGGDMDRAAARFHQAVKKFPNFLRAHKQLGLVHFRSGRNAEAIRSLTRVLELGGSDGTALGILGLAYLNTERWLSAESAYRSALLLQPDVYDWKLGLVRALFAQQKFGEVAALIDELLVLSSDRAELWLLQANAFLALGQPMKAAQNYEMLVRMNKATPEALNLLGDIYVNEKLTDLAGRAYVLAVEADPEKGGAGGVRAAEILAQRGALAPARAVIAAVREAALGTLADADKRRLLKTEARIASAEGSGGDAARVLQEIVALDPLDGEALLLLGRHYQRNADPERAILMYERAAGIAAFEADAKIRHAQVLVAQGKLEAAAPLLRRAQEIQPRDSVGQFLNEIEKIVRRSR